MWRKPQNLITRALEEDRNELRSLLNSKSQGPDQAGSQVVECTDQAGSRLGALLKVHSPCPTSSVKHRHAGCVAGFRLAAGLGWLGDVLS